MKRKQKKQTPLLTLATPAPTDREKMWATMRHQKTFTRNDIVRLADCNAGKVRDYLRGLTTAGYVSIARKAEPRARGVYEVIRDTGVDAPRVRTDGTLLPASGRKRMWDAMRVLGVFSPAELAAAASLPDVPVALGEVQSYCAWLARGGYLTGNAAVWQFIPAKFTGAKALQILRVKALYDPNINKVVYEAHPEGRDDE